MQKTSPPRQRRHVYYSAALLSSLIGLASAHAATIETQTNLVADGSINTTAGNNDRSDWNLVPTYQTDPDEGHDTDYKNISVANDSSNIYLRLQTYRTDSGGFNTYSLYNFIDTDQNKSTGFTGGTGIGADYLIEGPNLYKYSGTGGSDYSFTFVKTLSYDDYPLNDIEMTVDMASLGNPTAFDFVPYATSSQGDDYYPDRLGNGDEPYFTYVTPEPASAIWLAAGGVFLKRRKRQR